MKRLTIANWTQADLLKWMTDPTDELIERAALTTWPVDEVLTEQEVDAIFEQERNEEAPGALLISLKGREGSRYR